MTFHTDETAGSIHVVQNFEYADQAEREGDTSLVLTDIGKIARQ